MKKFMTLSVLLVAGTALATPAFADRVKSKTYRSSTERTTETRPALRNQAAQYQQDRQYDNYAPRSGGETRLGYGSGFRSGGYLSPLSGSEAYSMRSGRTASSRDMRGEYVSGSAREQRRYGSAYQGYWNVQ